MAHGTEDPRALVLRRALDASFVLRYGADPQVSDAAWDAVNEIMQKFDSRLSELDRLFVSGRWEGSLVEAAELLGMLPNGDRRRALKEAIFPLLYSGGPEIVGSAAGEEEETSAVASRWLEEYRGFQEAWGYVRDDSEHKHRWEPWGSYGDARCSEVGCPVVRTWKGEILREET